MIKFISKSLKLYFRLVVIIAMAKKMRNYCCTREHQKIHVCV